MDARKPKIIKGETDEDRDACVRTHILRAMKKERVSEQGRK